MKRTMKSILILAGIYSFNISVLAESNPNQFIDSRAQAPDLKGIDFDWFL